MSVGEPADDEEVRPSGLPEGSSEKRRVSSPDGELVSLRPPKKSDPPPPPRTPKEALPPGLGPTPLSTSARRRLELALDEDRTDPRFLLETPTPPPAEPKAPVGLKNLTTSARQRLELAVEADDHDVFDPAKPPVIPKERLSDPGSIPFDRAGRAVIASLARWVGFCGVITLGIGALTGLSYLTGEGSVAHVVVGILAVAISGWQLLAVWDLNRVLRHRRQQHHMVNALGHLRSALLLKALLVCAAMVLGCFTFSIAGSLLFLLG